VDYRGHTGTAGKLLQLRRTESSPNRYGTVVLNHHTLAEEPRQNANRGVCHGMPMEIVHEKTNTAGPPHFPEDTFAFVIGEVVKGQGTDDRIKRGIGEWKPRSVADNGNGLLRSTQSITLMSANWQARVAPACRRHHPQQHQNGRNLLRKDLDRVNLRQPD
jgi:hypothetical protein